MSFRMQRCPYLARFATRRRFFAARIEIQAGDVGSSANLALSVTWCPDLEVGRMAMFALMLDFRLAIVLALGNAVRT